MQKNPELTLDSGSHRNAANERRCQASAPLACSAAIFPVRLTCFRPGLGSRRMVEVIREVIEWQSRFLAPKTLQAPMGPR
jgi:hypothetical protein